MKATLDQRELVIAAARRRALEIGDEAGKYESLATPEQRRLGTGQMAIAEETLRDYFHPLMDAITAVEAEWAQIPTLSAAGLAYAEAHTEESFIARLAVLSHNGEVDDWPAEQVKTAVERCNDAAEPAQPK